MKNAIKILTQNNIDIVDSFKELTNDFLNDYYPQAKVEDGSRLLGAKLHQDRITLCFVGKVHLAPKHLSIIERLTYKIHWRRYFITIPFENLNAAIAALSSTKLFITVRENTDGRGEQVLKDGEEPILSGGEAIFQEISLEEDLGNHVILERDYVEVVA